jgi:hypothetical protein
MYEVIRGNLRLLTFRDEVALDVLVGYQRGALSSVTNLGGPPRSTLIRMGELSERRQQDPGRREGLPPPALSPLTRVCTV